jgi:hypothetical protein
LASACRSSSSRDSNIGMAFTSSIRSIVLARYPDSVARAGRRHRRAPAGFAAPGSRGCAATGRTAPRAEPISGRRGCTRHYENR